MINNFRWQGQGVNVKHLIPGNADTGQTLVTLENSLPIQVCKCTQ